MSDVVTALLWWLALALFVNVPLLVVYLWRSYRRKEPRLLSLGFEGPILCNIAALLATWIPPFPWIVLAVPWLLHVGTWVGVARATVRLGRYLRSA